MYWRGMEAFRLRRESGRPGPQPHSGSDANEVAPGTTVNVSARHGGIRLRPETMRSGPQRVPALPCCPWLSLFGQNAEVQIACAHVGAKTMFLSLGTLPFLALSSSFSPFPPSLWLGCNPTCGR